MAHAAFEGFSTKSALSITPSTKSIFHKQALLTTAISTHLHNSSKVHKDINRNIKSSPKHKIYICVWWLEVKFSWLCKGILQTVSKWETFDYGWPAIFEAPLRQ